MDRGLENPLLPVEEVTKQCFVCYIDKSDVCYWKGFFSLLQDLGIKPMIPSPFKIKRLLIRLRVKRGFVVEGGTIDRIS